MTDHCGVPPIVEPPRPHAAVCDVAWLPLHPCDEALSVLGWEENGILLRTQRKPLSMQLLP